MSQIPYPPLEMRSLVGPVDEEAFDIEPGRNIFDHLPDHLYERVFDFGSGCGRNARRLLMQRTIPRSYVGVDLHRGMVQWCQKNLTPVNHSFKFYHHDAFNLGLNPEGKVDDYSVSFPFPEGDASLVIAWSVFTHLLEHQIRPYLTELARICAAEGTIISTWFLFDKRDFPMMQDFQNCLYINAVDPTNAVIVDRSWLKDLLTGIGLRIVKANGPQIRGYQTIIELELNKSSLPHQPIPDDYAPFGRRPPPLMPRDADRIGPGF